MFPASDDIAMARRSKPDKDTTVTPTLRRHLKGIGVTENKYLDWCHRNRFEPSFDKTQKQLAAEAERAAQLAAQQAAAARFQNDPRQVIEAMFDRRLKWDKVQRPQLRDLCLNLDIGTRTIKDRPGLRDFVLWIEANTDLLYEKFRCDDTLQPVIAGLIRIYERRAQWQRPLADWQKTSHNVGRQWSSLLRHLFAKYPVPAFLDQAWLSPHADGDRFRSWFLHIGAGANIRTASTPIPLTKMMAHHFIEAPDDIGILAALRWAQVHGLGGDAVLSHAIAGSRLGTDLTNDEFWTTVLRFFIANPMLDRRHVGPIVDYLHAQRFELRAVMTPEGGLTQLPPPQPNLSMRGRTPDSLLGQVERWHGELGRIRKVSGEVFPASGIKSLDIEAGSREQPVLWRFRELRSVSELVEEGRAQRHCVASYAASCLAGRCSIWTMERHSEAGVEKRQTIEVTKEGAIVQCRGKQNRYPTESEMMVVRTWAQLAGLVVSRHARTA